MASHHENYLYKNEHRNDSLSWKLFVFKGEWYSMLSSIIFNNKSYVGMRIQHGVKAYNSNLWVFEYTSCKQWYH